MGIMGKKRCLFLFHFALLLFIFPYTFSGSREADIIHSYDLQKSTISLNITTKKFTITGRGGFSPLSFMTKKFTLTGHGGFTPLNIKTKTFTITGKRGFIPLAITTKKMVDDERLK